MENETSNVTLIGGMCDPEPTQQLIGLVSVQLVFYLVYSVIFISGIFGNVLVSLVVLKSPKNVTNLFILNLAFSDIVMSLFAVPFTPLHTFMGKWAFGEALCILFPFSQGVSVYMSTLTMTIIAMDRFVVIIFPYRARMQMKTCLVLIGIINFTALLFTAPYAVHMEHGLDPYSGVNGNYQCGETWDDGTVRTIYGAFTNVMQFVLPFVAIIFCYTAIIRKLAERSANRPGAPRSAAKEEQERARNQRTNRMLISMVVVFGICWLPLNTINFLRDLDLPIYCWEYFNFLFFICHVLAMSSTCYNPILYGRYNATFQTEFVKMIPALGYICGRPMSNNPVIEQPPQAPGLPPEPEEQEPSPTVTRRQNLVVNGNSSATEIKLVPNEKNGVENNGAHSMIATSATMV